MTVLRMANPTLRGGVYYLRVAVPRSLQDTARGRSLALRVGDETRTVKIGDRITTSLHTSDKSEARRRAADVTEQAETLFATLRGNRPALSHKQVLAFAGEMMKEAVAVFDDDPGDPQVWRDVLALNERLGAGATDAWALGEDGAARQMTREEALLARYAPAIARVEARHALYLTDDEKLRLADAAHRDMVDAAQVNLRKAEGDYADSGHRDRHPVLTPPQATVTDTRKADPKGHWSFAAVIERTAARRGKGSDAKPLSATAVEKYRLHCGRFAAHRGDADLRTVTARQAQDWLDAMADDPKLAVSNRVRGEHLASVKAVINYARKESLGAIFPAGNPLDVVERPAFKQKPKGAAALTVDEAKTILRKARGATDRPHIRWIPWLLAYSGARVGEIAALEREDFFQHGGKWFYRLRDKGNGTAKTVASVRTVPVHPALVEEGLLRFVEGRGRGPLFIKSAKALVIRWVREDAKIDRPDVMPTHGWRHLFTDFARVWMENDAAARAITGRADAGSMALYGGSEALLPGLWDSMAKVAPIKLD